LVWSGGVDVDAVQYTLTGSSGDVRSGAFSSSAPGDGVTGFRLDGVPEGGATTVLAFVGDTVSLSAAASGPSPSLLVYSWSSSLPIGSFGRNVRAESGATDETTFTCTARGTTMITLVVSESDHPDASDCPTSLTTVAVQVVCSPAP
jgi:hypothetical protein